MSKTLFDKIWDKHVVTTMADGTALLYIDRHLVHEVTSPQAFEGLRLTGRTVRRPDLSFATMDHNVPTDDRSVIKDPISLAQVEALRKNCKDFGITLYDLDSDKQGIVHIIGPELGITLPGLTMVCGDSTPRRTGRLERWPSVSAPRRSSTCWPPRPCGRKNRNVQGRIHRAVEARGHLQGHDPEVDRDHRHGGRHRIRH
jgi:hypothetical protein